MLSIDLNAIMHRLLLLSETLDIGHQSLSQIDDLVERLTTGETEAARAQPRRDHQALPEPRSWAPPLRDGQGWVCQGYSGPFYSLRRSRNEKKTTSSIHWQKVMMVNRPGHGNGHKSNAKPWCARQAFQEETRSENLDDT